MRLSLKPLAMALLLAASTTTGASLGATQARDRLSGNSECQPVNVLFTARSTESERLWIPLDSPSSYSLGSDGLNLFLDKPSGKITTKGHVNSKVAEGSTINSTFTLK